MVASVSVIIPTFNGSKYIGRCIQSVLEQRLLPIEIIVSDDASVDETIERVREQASGTSIPVEILNRCQNSGSPALPLQEGVRKAKGELIAILDQDDVFLPEKIACESELLCKYPELSCVASFSASSEAMTSPLQGEHVVRDLTRVGSQEGNYYRLGSHDAVRMFLEHGNFVIGFPGFMFRKQQWLAKGHLDTSLRIAADYDFLLWLAMNGDVAVIPQIHYYRQEHNGNMCRNRVQMYLDVFTVRTRYLRLNRSLVEDRSLGTQLYARYLGAAYWFRQGGFHREALQLYRLAARVWGWNREILCDCVKVGAHWLIHQLKQDSYIPSGWTTPSS